MAAKVGPAGAAVEIEPPGQVRHHGGLVRGRGLEDVRRLEDVDVVRVREELAAGFAGGGWVVVRGAQILEAGLLRISARFELVVVEGAAVGRGGVYAGAAGGGARIAYGVALLLQAQLVQQDALVEGAVGVAAIILAVIVTGRRFSIDGRTARQDGPAVDRIAGPVDHLFQHTDADVGLQRAIVRVTPGSSPAPMGTGIGDG
mmetsp:Transcript_22595/g.53555  ORF Transcript_22595/g.53555 Transcript_22595/m.53555 type:complete len:202 (-) Transcript_22595:315-920(-)